MSEPTLYLDLGCRHLRVCDSAVPVERCEHGNIDGHYLIDFGQGHNERTTVGPWCPGAGIGGDE